MIRYRDHRGSLDESIKTQQLFKDVGQMLSSIAIWHYVATGERVLSREIGEREFIDDRISWNKCHHVLVNGYCVGFCNIEED
jgi:hypothetical protein